MVCIRGHNLWPNYANCLKWEANIDCIKIMDWISRRNSPSKEIKCFLWRQPARSCLKIYWAWIISGMQKISCDKRRQDDLISKHFLSGINIVWLTQGIDTEESFWSQKEGSETESTQQQAKTVVNRRYRGLFCHLIYTNTFERQLL